MYSIVLGVLFFCLILACLYFLKVEFKSKANLAVLALVILCVLAAFMYERKSADFEEKKEAFLANFFAKKSQKCGDISIDSLSFNYNYATTSFISKTQKTMIIDLKTCIK